MSFTKINHYEKEYADTHHECALTVTEGVENQPVVNPYFVRKKKRALTTEEYVEGILQGNITTLSQAITLVESSNPDHYAQAQEIIEKCLPHAGKSVRIGITGVPGAGKSTFIEAVGNDTLLEGKSVVLNLEGMKLDLAQRIVDSVSGGCYAIQGNLQKISGYIYLVTPHSVDITGDFQDLVHDSSDYSSTAYSRRNY